MQIFWANETWRFAKRRQLPEPEPRNSIKKSFAFRRGLIGWKQNSFTFIANRLKPPRPRCNKQSPGKFAVIALLSGKRSDTSDLSANVKLNQRVHNIQLKPIYWRDSVRCLMFVLDTTSLSAPLSRVSRDVIATTANWFPLFESFDLFNKPKLIIMISWRGRRRRNRFQYWLSDKSRYRYALFELEGKLVEASVTVETSSGKVGIIF